LIGAFAIGLLATELPIADAATCGAGDGLRPCAGHGVLNAVVPPVVHRHPRWRDSAPADEGKATQGAHSARQAGGRRGAAAAGAEGATGGHAGHGGHYH
jgi:hypothetical protein